MMIGVDPKVDYAFKHLFGRESSKPMLIDIINQVLGLTGKDAVLEIDILNPFNLKETRQDKFSILDIKAKDQIGRQFNVEMQMLKYPDYLKRIIYYSARFYSQQISEGDDYDLLRPTISISFLDHVLFPNSTEFHSRYRLLEVNRHTLLTEDLDFHIIELPKFFKTDVQLTSDLDSWLYFLRHAEKINTEAIPVGLQKPMVVKAIEVLGMLTQSEIERAQYEDRFKAQLDHNSSMRGAHRQGVEEGIERGKKLSQIASVQKCERLLDRAESPEARLIALSQEQLGRMAEQLLEELLAAKSS